MSRRESRVSMNVRQNDALLEFENFKKKFLLANKHITKLNSTLSVRIEELNAQISTLYVENLRLRASEIALAAQLKKERDRSQRIMADAESAMHNLMKNFGLIRKNFNVPAGKPTSPSKHASMPKARRPILNPEASPHVNRLARAPNFPEIFEEEEADSELDEDAEASPSPAARRKKPRASSSRLPVPSRVASPPPQQIIATIQIDVDESLLNGGRKKISRRQSGLIGTSSSSTSSSGRSATPSQRPPSPAFGSPLRRDAGLAEEEEEFVAIHGQREEEIDEELERAARKERKKRAKARDAELVAARERERAQRAREEEQGIGLAEGSKFRLKDVTNSPTERMALPPLNTTLVSDIDRQQSPDSDLPSSAMTHASTSTRPMMSTPSTTPAPPSHLPTPRSSSPPPIPDVDAPPPGGREKRVRKSVNYAEPKLNTKMRKPDPAPASTASSSKRMSMTSQPPPQNSNPAPRTSLERAASPDSPAVTTVRRKKSRPRLPPEDNDDSDGAQADQEFTASGLSMGYVDGRRRSAHVSARRPMGDIEESRRHSLAV
ncbi:hypothetical protein BV25DRAFT_1826018 [Artomyces pyxidatus]|uniref:Uncharacterized protein n=1 Tax=Artomyces pyxidatus TaxID=48021 RepID=A0ACB8T096_9AGAM|nr:hypothetical protein BV25DRAFT_1826018 [Artomyces pyxidatus]